MEFAVPAHHKVKLKDTEKRNKYLELVGELKDIWNMKVAVIPIVTGALGTIPNGLVQGLEDLKITGQVETIQTTVLLRSARILKRVLESWYHSNSSEKPSTNAYRKNYQRSKQINK